jgi:hypothetical protein
VKSWTRLILVSSVLLVAAACGSDENVPKAMVLPVDGLEVPGFSLAGPESRCSALVAFVSQFSVQHAPGVFHDAACEQDAATGRVKLAFKITDARGAAAPQLGSGVVQRSAGGGVQLVLCRPIQPGGSQDSRTDCFGVDGGENGSGVPKAWRTDALKVDDLLVSIQDFLQR